jgi:hypothetical protein
MRSPPEAALGKHREYIVERAERRARLALNVEEKMEPASGLEPLTC